MRILTSSESELGCVGHAVALVEDNQLNALAHELLSRAEALDLFPHHVDASVVRRIQLQRHVFVILSVQLLGNCDHAGGLSRAWGAVEEKMRQLPSLDEFPNYNLNK